MANILIGFKVLGMALGLLEPKGRGEVVREIVMRHVRGDFSDGEAIAEMMDYRRKREADV